MRFSVIIPVYKVEKYLRQCVDSVLCQSFPDFQVILVDDGSPDSCPQICDEYAGQDKRVKVVHKPNGGLSDARNKGIDIAKGEFILFLDSDDWWDDSDFLYKLSQQIERGNPDIVVFGMKKYFSADDKIADIRVASACDRATGALSHAQAIQKYMRSNIFVACACDKATRRSMVEKSLMRFVKGRLSEDIEWCCRLLLNEPHIAIIAEAPYVYRQQVPTSISANVGPRNINDILTVIRKYADKKASEPLLHFLANQYVLMITNLMRLPQKERKQFDAEIKSFGWLLDYNWYPYVRKVSKVKFLGYRAIKTLLRLYYKARR